ncbi:MAG TPA: glycosyltransferase family 2 protein [Sedimentisphaerales bacterium]|nr:glycosyltransferase family 2 protein [Sedimentisphaerales bacterium]
MNNLPDVSIVIPCRNEEKFIGQCLDSIIGNDYPKDKLQLLVVDGMSEDGTRKIVKEYAERLGFIELVDNCERITSSAFNKGIKAAKGEVVLIMSAHSTCEGDYISQCVNYLTNTDADNVGGLCKILPQDSSLIANSIAYALSSSFGAGNAYYRTGSRRPRYVDTVFGGCYRRSIFERIGFFDEDLVRTQDSEFNARLLKNGGRILLVPTIVSYYYTRRSLRDLWKMNLQYGYYKPLAARKIGKVYTARQLIPPLFVVSLAGSLMGGMFYNPLLLLFVFILGFYMAVNLGFSLRISLEKGLRYLFVLPLVFGVIHFGWGIGYLKGVLDFIVFNKTKGNRDLPITR